MSETRYQLVKHIYYEASDKPAAERETFLNDACNGDAALRHEVLNLLSAPAESEAFLEVPAVSSEALREVAMASFAEAAAAEPLPEHIGRYRIIRLLGEGGMGSVYEAEQDTPQRRVALKVLRAGMCMPRVMQRFQQEVEVLGRLQHPGIARIYDAGVAEVPRGGGRSHRLPFFAMELIDGRPITHYADAHHLEMAQRLELLARVCDAVHFGHQQGVIHRDLKPANILVIDDLRLTIDDLSAGDREPARAKSSIVNGQSLIPKVIDFGVARATNADIAITTLNTDAGQILGTLAYMSPEQVRGDAGAIDARCDVYALGVLGYELLAGRLPYDVTGKIVPEAARIIRDEEPSRLSSISRVFRGDIETIFAKALEKEPARRYASAAALAADIRRYLNDEPIIARPPTLRYQLSKFARRHKEFVAGLALVFLVLVGGLVVSISALFHARAQERNAHRVSDVMQQILSYAAPGTPGGGRDVKVVQMLDAAADELLGQLADAPEIEITLRRTLGETYARLGEDETAQRHYERALQLAVQIYGRDTLDVYDLSAEMWLAKHWKPGEGDMHSIRAIADSVDQWLLAARGKAPPEHPAIQRLLYASGRMNMATWRTQPAIASLSELLQVLQPLPPERRVVTELEVRAALVVPLSSVQRFDESEAMAREVLASLDGVSPTIAFNIRVDMLNVLGSMVESQQRLEEAATYYGDALALQREVRGRDHPGTWANANLMWGLMVRMERYPEALAFSTEVCEANERNAPEGDWLAYLYSYRALTFARIGWENEAAAAFEKAIVHRRAHIGGDWLALEWWRGAVESAGQLFRPWASESLRRFVWRHVDHTLRREPTADFALDELDWSQARYTLERWDGERAIKIAEGPFEQLRELADPEPGLVRITVRCPRKGRDELLAGGWLLASPWQLDLVREYRHADAIDQSTATQAGPHELREWPALAFEQNNIDFLGPARAPLCFGIHATSSVQLPAGRYRLHATFDDGARLWMDGRLVFDAFDRAGRHPGSFETEVEFDDQPHELRVEYFQHGMTAVLWVSAEPLLETAQP